MRNFKYIKKFRRFGGKPFLDSTDFVGMNKNGVFWAVNRNGTRTKIKDVSCLEWAQKNWQEVD